MILLPSGAAVSVPEDIQWFLFGDRSFIGEDVHIDEIVAAAQNLPENPEREAVAVRGPRFLKGEYAAPT